MGKLLYITLFVTCWFFRGTAQQDTASIKKLGNSYIDSSKLYPKDRQKGKGYVQKAITLFSNAKLFTDLGYAYWELSGYYDLSIAQYPDKSKCIQLAIDAWHQAGNTKKEADGLKELGDVRQINDDYQAALTDLKRSIELYKTIGEQNVQGVYDLMGAVSCQLGNFNDAIQYGLLAVQAAEKIKDTSMQLSTIYNRLGITYYYLRDYEQSSGWYAKSLAIAEKYKSDELYVIAYNYGNNLIMLNRNEECNRLLNRILKTYPAIDTPLLIYYTCSFLTNALQRNQFAAAEKYFHQLNALRKNIQMDAAVRRNVYDHSIRYLLRTGRNREAREMLEQMATARDINLVNWPDYELHWINLDSAIGDYRAAFSRFRRYTTLKDSMYSVEKTRNIARMNVLYETSKKDKDILLKAKDIELLKQNTQLQSADLANARLTRNWALAVGALLAIIATLFIRTIRIKQKANRKLQSQQKEIEDKNTTLEQLVNEKEWLVKEIHHRVKNNFHMVIALLGAQSKFLRTNEAIRAITDSQNRVYAMALVHQKLYQSETLSSILMPEYIHDLVHYFREAMDSGRIQFRTDVDHVGLSLTYCTPLGLIINEAITNAVKYAFPDKQDGIISISFKQHSHGSFILKITDDGIGLPPGFAAAKATSMGMRLIAGLSEDLDAKLTITSAKGTTITIGFTIDPEDQDHFDNANTRVIKAV